MIYLAWDSCWVLLCLGFSWCLLLSRLLLGFQHLSLDLWREEIFSSCNQFQRWLLCHVQAALTSGLCLRMAWRLAVLAYGFSLSIILKFFRGFFFSTLRLIFLLQWQYQTSSSTCTNTKVDKFKETVWLRTSVTIRTQKHGPEVEHHHKRQVKTHFKASVILTLVDEVLSGSPRSSGSCSGQCWSSCAWGGWKTQTKT